MTTADSRTEKTREVVRKYFTDLAQGDLASALSLLSPDIEFELPVNRWNEVIPYLGRHVGGEAVARAFQVRGETTEVLDYALREIRADDDTAFAIIYTKAAHTRTRQEFEIEDSHRLTVDASGRISAWKVYFDPTDEVAAFNADREARLISAAWSGDCALASELIKAGADVNARDPGTGLTALMIAAGRADETMVPILIAAGADVFAADARAGATALHKACQGGSLAVARALIEAGAFVDAVAPTTGHTPLMDALWFKYPEIARFLLQRGAGLNLSTHYGFSLAEHFAYELSVNTTGKERLLLAEQYLTQRRQDDEARAAGHRMMAAVTRGDAPAVRKLLDDGDAVDERFPIVNGFNDAHTPLLVAARDGHHEIVAILLEAGADVNATEPTFGAVPLHKAVYNGHAGIARVLAAWPGVNLDYQGATNGYTPLHDALWHGYEDCASAMLDAGADVRLLGHDGKTPLDLAAEVFGDGHPLTLRLRALS
jgi:ankyrin repeat protein